uniref:Uncharacterized protein n=1 Tax=Anguilla anguilla TaxID=7936 RepID=A0A0E9TPW0_ANGAN
MRHRSEGHCMPLSVYQKCIFPKKKM